jgi:excisionase family DNA binding protein
MGVEVKPRKKEMRPHGMDVLLDTQQVCDVLSIKPPTLSRMVHSGKIPHILLGTGKKKWSVRFRRQEIEAWLTRRSRGPAPIPKASSNLKEVDKRNGGTSQPIENKEVTPFQQTGVNTFPPLKANSATIKRGESKWQE